MVERPSKGPGATLLTDVGSNHERDMTSHLFMPRLKVVGKILAAPSVADIIELGFGNK